MTSPVIEGDQQMPPEDIIELLRANLDAKKIQLSTAISTIGAQNKIIRFLKDLAQQPDPIVQALRVRVAEETVRAEVRMKSRIKVLEASEDRLCISANDGAYNVCRLANAALSHLQASAQADLDGPNPYIHHDSPTAWKEHSDCIQAAIDLLKPLATGVHHTELWQEGDMTNFADTPKDSVGMTVLNNDNYELWTEWLERQPKIQDNTDYMKLTDGKRIDFPTRLPKDWKIINSRGEYLNNVTIDKAMMEAYGIEAEMCTTVDAPDIRGIDPTDPSMGDDPWNEWDTWNCADKMFTRWVVRMQKEKEEDDEK